MTSNPSPDLDLDSLLSESVEAQKQSQAISRLKGKALGGMTSPEDLARLREWQDRTEWVTEARVLILSDHICKCGSPPATIFLGFGLRQRHKSLKHGASRWVPCKREELPLHLPKEVRRVHNLTDICAECATTKGWYEDVAFEEPAVAAPESAGDRELGLVPFDNRFLPLSCLE